MRPLRKFSITIWAEPEANEISLEDLAREAAVGAAYCSKMGSDLIQDPEKDPDWDGTEFFGEE